MSLKVFIQARMSSRRLPGKVLMPFNGEPIINNVVNTVGYDKAIVLTSTEISDDPLVEHLKACGIAHYRGDLNDVYGRFCGAINKFNPGWVMRICADSPLIPSILLNAMEQIERTEADIVSNIYKRSFPKGHSVEIIRASTMLKIKKENLLTAEDREHVTPYFYRNADRFKIISVEQTPNMSHDGLAIDTQEDYDRLTNMAKLNMKYTPSLWKVSSNV